MIIRLEKRWKSDPAATYSSLNDDSEEEEDDVQPLLIKYEDGYHFQNLVAPLVKLEADEDREQKEAVSEDRMSVEWEKGVEGGWRAAFTLQEGVKIARGDELTLSLDRGGVFLNGGKEVRCFWWNALGCLSHAFEYAYIFARSSTVVRERLLQGDH